MKIFRHSLLLIILLISPVIINAQYYTTGQDPAGLKWLQVRTGNYTVIYPEKYGHEGIEFAKSLDRANLAMASLFPMKKFRLPVVIHNFTVESNGYVAWAPKRMEILPTPEQNTIPLDFRSQLTLHEPAHVYQMEALDHGTTKILSYFLGQQITGLSALLLPNWFMEGDAVFAETVLSESGRGRSPDFQKNLKAIAIEKDHFYKYDKLVCGSFRDYTPDHYQFGYQMVTWSFASAGTDLWNDIMSFTAMEPFTFNPVNLKLREKTGLTKKLLYDQTFEVLKNQWKKEISQSGALKYASVSPDKKNIYINYYSPVYAGLDSIISVKTSLADPPSFVLIDPSNKTEKKLHVPGNIYPFFISYAGGKIIWVEITVDPRWANREYSVIKMKDIKTGMTVQLTHRSRYMSAAISPDTKMIAAVENTFDNKNSLVFVDTQHGKIIKKIPAPGNASLQEPRWSGDGSAVTVISLTEGGEGVLSFFPGTGIWKTYLEAGRNDIQSALVRNDSLFFTSSVSGVENGFVKAPSGKIVELTNSRFGANDMGFSGTGIIFSDYTSSGNEICMIPLPDASIQEFRNENKASMLADRFNIKPAVKEEDDRDFSPEPYRKWQHLFNFHSWMPFYTDINAIQSEPASLRPGFTIMSQNVLSTLTATAGYEYSDTRKNMLHTNITWAGWYPVIQSQLDYGSDPIIHREGNNPVPASIQTGYHFVNTISLPLNFSNGKFSQFLYLGLASDYQNNYIFISNSAGYDAGQNQVSGRLYFYNYYKSSLRDIYPRWAQVIDLAYVYWPFDKSLLSPDTYLKTAFYFPGVMRNNSLILRFETEKIGLAKYHTANRISFPRGYSNYFSYGLNFFSAEYQAPLFYPDLNISSLLYITRLRACLFYDHATGTNNLHYITQNGQVVTEILPSTENFDSFGAQLLADFHLFRIPYRISSGVQAAWKGIGTAPVIGMIFNMDINGTTIGRRARL